LADRTAPTLLTPHAGELARVLGLDASARSDIEARRLHHALAAAAELGVTVLLKGSTTVVCSPDGLTRVNPTGTSWLATAGSGDVLSGSAGALLAGGLSPLDAGSCGAYLHGCAARLAAARSEGAAPIIADDVVQRLPDAIAGLRAR
jgi:NAD(P)H-hydrate repair Nnr-like enzyme with NAD(P)H-hydrate dehydratase domain